MIQNDSCKLYGRLQMFQTIDGTMVEIFDDHNLILNVGKIALLQLLTGDLDGYIAQMAIGNGNVPQTAPNVNDSALDHQITSKIITTATVDEINKVAIYEASFSSGDYSPTLFEPYDEEINEAGLKLNATLFARKTFNARAFSVTDNITITFRWSVGII